MKPYDTLYIYEINGEIKGAKDRFHDDFLGCWLEGGYSYLFFSAKKEHELKGFALSTDEKYISETVLDYEDWEAADKIAPFKVGNLFICPVWDEYQARDDEVIIRLDPGVMFGSGYHPTTRKCIEALWRIYQWDSPKRVLDMGTGTGLLSIVAAKLGGKDILALDNNNLAVETCARNIALNDSENEIRVVHGDVLDYLKREADLLCANLHYDIIEKLVMNDAFYTKKWYILSGLLGTQVNKVLSILEGSSIDIIETVSEQSWFTLLGKMSI